MKEKSGLISVMINGRIHRLSAKALSLLKIKEKDSRTEVPIELQKLPPNLEIIRMQKKEVVKAPEQVQEKVPVIVVKKKEAVTAESTGGVKPKRKRNVRKVGVKEQKDG